MLKIQTAHYLGTPAPPHHTTLKLYGHDHTCVLCGDYLLQVPFVQTVKLISGGRL
jgi:hypothetical protein